VWPRSAFASGCARLIAGNIASYFRALTLFSSVTMSSGNQRVQNRSQWSEHSPTHPKNSLKIA
jgi:hypothetical protein